VRSVLVQLVSRTLQPVRFCRRCWRSVRRDPQWGSSTPGWSGHRLGGLRSGPGKDRRTWSGSPSSSACQPWKRRGAKSLGILCRRRYAVTSPATTTKTAGASHDRPGGETQPVRHSDPVTNQVTRRLGLAVPYRTTPDGEPALTCMDLTTTNHARRNRRAWHARSRLTRPGPAGSLYRFRTRHMAVDLRFGGMGGLRHDRGSCLSVCCTCLWSGCSAGWCCWAGARRPRTRRSWCCVMR